MPSDNLPGFPADEQGKPPGKRELARLDKEMNALDIWRATNSLSEVRKRLKLSDNRQAEVLVNRGAKRYVEERVQRSERVGYAVEQNLMIAMQKLIEKIEDGEVHRSRDLAAVADRLRAMLDLDARKDAGEGVRTVVMGDVNLTQINVPDGGETIDLRDPWDRPENRREVIEGEFQAEGEEEG